MLKPGYYLFILFFLPIASRCQLWAGPEAGISIGHLHTDFHDNKSSAIKKVAGGFAGIRLIKKINRSFYAETIPSWLQINYSVIRTGDLSGVITTYHNNYLQLPVAGYFIAGKKLRISAGAGLYGALWLSGSEKGKIPDIFSASGAGNSGTTSFTLIDFTSRHNFKPGIDNRLGFGWMASTGLQYPFHKNLLLTLNCRYWQSLTDQQKKYMAQQAASYNQALTISAGALFILNNHNL